MSHKAAAAPVSRKDRLMAAIAPGEESSLSGSAARLHCFICGGWMSPGREQQLQVRDGCDSPYFPFLLQQEPAPGARAVSAEGWVSVCSVCRCFLGEQWEAFERSRTPVDKRMYWLKRPHQCDSRRAPQEWNPSYQPEGSLVQGRGSASQELLDSSLSSLSDQDISDQELELDHLAHPPHPGLGTASTRAHHLPPGLALPFGTPSAQDLANSHQAQHRNAAYPRAMQGADADAVPTPGMSPHAAASSSDETPGQLTPFKFSDGSNICGSTSSEDELIVPGSRANDAGQNGEISVQEVARINRQVREVGSIIAKARSAAAPQDHSCFICGARLLRNTQHRVHVQKQESTSTEPFFPFLWLHNPPPGACPLSPEGSTLICSFCHVSLMQQWQGFEMANVPVLQRLYVVPLNAAVLGTVTKSIGERDPGGGRKPPLPCCYLCGEDCGRETRAVHSRSLTGRAQDNPMYFPFIRLLPCPPNSKAMTECGEVSCCRRCYAVLEDMWAAYTVSECEELISSTQAFLRSYLQVNAGTSHPNAVARQTLRAGRTSVCLLCGTELEPGREFQLNVNPPSRHGDREPFFPFLASYLRPARAQPVDSTGLAFACVLCYHDLLEQWWRGKNSQHPSSPWSRQYKVDMFVCFFCRQERRRNLGLKTITINRLPVFLHAPRVAEALVVDNGEYLTIGTCEDCRAVVLAGNCLKQGSQMDSLLSSSNAKVNHLFIFSLLMPVYICL
ncbi:hypothetical protein scyTo_0003669 [Scyliorhinus torazame]|uniref:Uncharacterized protein n=1 Tax=Scyliorhinus torazame TaxID=75743 RepID=A0A401PN99_SCYTO|nr:hypothetical protein [Scyliorhinus torazame]